MTDNAFHDPTSFEALLQLLELRLHNGAAVSEYELLTWLQAPEQAIFDAGALQDPLTMFRCHFILMHCLYRLRAHWLAHQEALLEISALRIQRLPWQASTDSAVDVPDPLAAYYLDLTQLATDRDSVDALLSSFWKRMLVTDTLMQDLQTLELDENASEDDIRRQYRRLAMRHHPDRGGEEASFCRIQTSYQRLKTRFL